MSSNIRNLFELPKRFPLMSHIYRQALKNHKSLLNLTKRNYYSNRIVGSVNGK